MRGALLVAGTTSDAGKSVLVAGLCRWLRRQGVDVAPFKAQNMSNNSVVTTDGGEIGRAQALQAAACDLRPSVAFNPVLLKPGSDRTSQVVVHGRVDGTVTALSYRDRKAALLDVVTTTLARLRAEHDVVVCEGAGSPAEINLRATDIANMGLARAADLPTIVVGDIDRGGVLAHLFGTLAVLEPADQALVAGFVVNKFRGDPALLEPGLAQLGRLTGRPTLGVLPFASDLWIDAEDSLGHDGAVGRPAPPLGRDWLRVAVVRLPRVSNGTDVDALATEPGVAVRYVTSPGEVVGADLVVLPGSKATVSDLAWLRENGLADAVTAHARAGRPVLGICGGYQMLARTIDDPHGVEAAPGRHAGLGLLDVDVVFDPDKHLGNPAGTALGAPVAGYEIHHGREVRREGAAPLVTDADGTVEGVDAGPVLGTHWHGLLENDGFRRRLLERVATTTGAGFRVSTTTSFAAARTAQLDLLADLVETHLDTAGLRRLIEHGAPVGLRVVPPAGAP
ncbi:cobyric acid synthase [Actinomycetospora sp. TBRC 11914]|uniref:cobyric acid synthase n=1 Tax=Actinomycetospora sp. TBRC 11914 TaxID=2729387 RepID=UPI00145EB9FB|nr:cobyric acid synthase [Actinomycetospora sp. TBRC 11914]NMO89988.1 cobyric acid synthase [Actinomycetospora sp. TBRC 11914]